MNDKLSQAAICKTPRTDAFQRYSADSNDSGIHDDSNGSFVSIHDARQLEIELAAANHLLIVAGENIRRIDDLNRALETERAELAALRKSHEGLNLLRLRHGIELESDPIDLTESQAASEISLHWRNESCQAAYGVLKRFASTHQDVNHLWAIHIVEAANRKAEEVRVLYEEEKERAIVLRDMLEAPDDKLTRERDVRRQLAEAADAVSTVSSRIRKAIPEYAYEMHLIEAALAASRALDTQTS